MLFRLFSLTRRVVDQGDINGCCNFTVVFSYTRFEFFPVFRIHF